ncbi:MAG: hypothetical protein HYY25_05075 [Candidatus Wallbacteria bacterium]|nr:hypothetical protein [Candidatus Wallbacteria bacterium]
MKRRPVDLAAVKRARADLRELVRQHPELTLPENQARLSRRLAEEFGQEESPMPARSPRRKTAAELVQVVHFRVTPEDLVRLGALAERFPMFSRNALSRAALRVGIAAIEGNPSLLLEPGIPAKK